MAKRKQTVYSDFSGGFNDSVAAISIKDTEVCVSENADYSAEIKSFRTRKGCTKVNTTSFGADVTDAHVWTVGGKNLLAYVKGANLYSYDDGTDTSTLKIALTANTKKIYPFVVFNRLYFGDGAELYVWGDFDFSASEGTVSISSGKIVKNDVQSGASGDLGHFYQYSGSAASVNLSTANYKGTGWTDVTEAPYFASSVVRTLTPYNPSRNEIAKVTVISGAEAAGNITVVLDDTPFTAAIAAGDSVATVVTKLKNISATGWTVTSEANMVIFSKDTVGTCINGYVDPGTTGCTLTYITSQEGKINDNKLDPIKKCTMFVVHTASYRVFATGNPDDNAVFYSEIGNPAYFKSDFNKVYGLNSYGSPTGLMQLSESVLVSFENGWYAWNGITPLEDASWRPLNIPYGCVSNDTIALTPYSFMYLGRDGIYNVSASILNSEIVMVQGRRVIEKITKSKVDKTIESIKDPTKCVGIFFNNVYYLAYNRDTDDNDRVLKYEWDTDSFTEVTGWKVNSWFADGSWLYFATTNYLLRANDSESDIDVETGKDKAIELYIKTKEYHFGNPFVNKVVNLVGLIFKQPIIWDDVSVNVRVIAGYNTYEVRPIDVTESLIWNRDWGRLWGFREAITKMIEYTFNSNTFQIEFRNNHLNSPVTLVAIGFVYEETDFVIPTILKDEVLLT